MPQIGPLASVFPPGFPHPDVSTFFGPLPVGIAVTILLVVACIAYRACQRCHTPTLTGSWVYLMLTTDKITHEIPVRPINHAINSIKVLFSPSVLKMGVKFACKACQGLLRVTWVGQLRYTVDGVPFEMTFPPVLRLAGCDVRSIKQALGDRDHIVSLVARDTYGNHIQLTPNVQHSN